MNIKTNILFFVKNTISKVKTIKQGHHLAVINSTTILSQSNCKFGQRIIISCERNSKQTL